MRRAAGVQCGIVSIDVERRSSADDPRDSLQAHGRALQKNGMRKETKA